MFIKKVVKNCEPFEHKFSRQGWPYTFLGTATNQHVSKISNHIAFPIILQASMRHLKRNLKPNIPFLNLIIMKDAKMSSILWSISHQGNLLTSGWPYEIFLAIWNTGRERKATFTSKDVLFWCLLYSSIVNNGTLRQDYLGSSVIFSAE